MQKKIVELTELDNLILDFVENVKINKYSWIKFKRDILKLLPKKINSKQSIEKNKFSKEYINEEYRRGFNDATKLVDKAMRREKLYVDG